MGDFMKRIYALICALGMLVFASEAMAQSECRDGSYSNSSGSGTCSHHGGEAGSGR